MQVDDFFLASVGGYLPPALPVSHALAEGWYDGDRAVEHRLESVTIEPELSPPEMAVRAGQLAIRRSGHPVDKIDLLLHATFYRQGPEFWTSASYVERFAVGNSCPAIEIMQGCNGGFAGLELAMGYLRTLGRTAAIITTADRYVGDFDRWRTDSGMVFGDGAAAVVLSRRPGFARIRSLVTRTDPILEEMHRGDEPLAFAAERRGYIDVTARKKSFLKRVGLEQSLKWFRAQLTGAVNQALAEASTGLDDVAVVALPHLGHKLIEREYLVPLGIPLERTTWPWGRSVGHLGVSDQFVALEHLLSVGKLVPGQQVLMVGVGIGFTWCATVLEILERPDWAQES
jgi:3-oxoacyl-[acyl-carrier-protein] synthase-3